MASTLEMLSPTAASTSCRTTPRSSFRTRLPRPARTGAAPRESVSSVHLAASCDFFADGCDPPGRSRRLYATAGLRTAGSRLSDHSGADILSRSKPERGGDDGDGATGTSIRRTAGPEPDDLLKLRRHFRHRAAVHPCSGYRRGRGRGAVCDKRVAEFVAIQPAFAAYL